MLITKKTDIESNTTYVAMDWDQAVGLGAYLNGPFAQGDLIKGNVSIFSTRSLKNILIPPTQQLKSFDFNIDIAVFEQQGDKNIKIEMLREAGRRFCEDYINKTQSDKKSRENNSRSQYSSSKERSNYNNGEKYLKSKSRSRSKEKKSKASSKFTNIPLSANLKQQEITLQPSHNNMEFEQIKKNRISSNTFLSQIS